MASIGIPAEYLEGSRPQLQYQDTFDDEDSNTIQVSVNGNGSPSENRSNKTVHPPRSPRYPKALHHRSRAGSNNSENSSGSGASHDSSHLSANPASHILHSSAPASRASSFREGKRPHVSRRSPSTRNGSAGGRGHSKSNISDDSLLSSGSRNEIKTSSGVLNVDQPNLGRRRSSMPNVAGNLLTVPNADGTRLRRVRSFKTTSKGALLNRGDSFKKKSTHSLVSAASAMAEINQLQQEELKNNNIDPADIPTIPTFYRIIMMGCDGTGKSHLAKQFMTSDFVGTGEESPEGNDQTVTVLLDGEESTIEVIDPPESNNALEDSQLQSVDAYIVVFACNDHSTFDQARELVRYLRVELGTDKVVILVANKTDLVRKRRVTADEARLAAETYDCKYTETSAAVNHHVDELLVGILTQIRLHMSLPFTTISFPGKEQRNKEEKKEKRRRIIDGPLAFFAKLFRRNSKKVLKPCENLYVL